MPILQSSISHETQKKKRNIQPFSIIRPHFGPPFTDMSRSKPLSNLATFVEQGEGGKSPTSNFQHWKSRWIWGEATSPKSPLRRERLHDAFSTLRIRELPGLMWPGTRTWASQCLGFRLVLFRFLIGSLVKAKGVHVILNFKFFLDLSAVSLILGWSIPISVFFQKMNTSYDIRKQKTLWHERERFPPKNN